MCEGELPTNESNNVTQHPNLEPKHKETLFNSERLFVTPTEERYCFIRLSISHADIQCYLELA